MDFHTKKLKKYIFSIRKSSEKTEIQFFAGGYYRPGYSLIIINIEEI